LNPYYKLIRGEDILVIIKIKSEIGFWQYQFFGFLSLFMERGNDYFIITNKRILISIKNNIKTNSIYSDFSKITFNTKSDQLSFVNETNEIKKVSLSNFNLDYDDYQYLKQRLKK
jgi:hypothetical protein